MTGSGQFSTDEHGGCIHAFRNAPKADAKSEQRQMSRSANGDICSAANCSLFDHLVGEREQLVGDG